MDMSLTEGSLGIEGDSGLCHGMAVQHTHPVPSFISIAKDLPIQCLVDYEVRGFFEWDAGSTDILAAGSSDYQVAIGPKGLLSKFATLVYAALQRCPLSSSLKSFVDTPKPSCSANESPATNLCRLQDCPLPKVIPHCRKRYRRPVLSEQKRDQIL